MTCSDLEVTVLATDLEGRFTKTPERGESRSAHSDRPSRRMVSAFLLKSQVALDGSILPHYVDATPHNAL